MRSGLILLLAGLVSLPAGARVRLTVEEALDLAFPGATIEKESVFLTGEQRAAVARESGTEIASSLVVRHLAHRDGRRVGVAYLDTHRVRTLPETLMIAVDPQGRVARVEVVSFREPQEYRPARPWYDQLLDRRLDRELQLDRGIRPITGATLTARATVDAVRRALALHHVLEAP